MIRNFTNFFNSMIDHLYRKPINKEPNILFSTDIAYSGGVAEMDVVDGYITIRAADPADDVRLFLNAYTIDELRTAIVANPAYTMAPVTPGQGELNAMALVERDKHNIANADEQKLYIHTTWLWDYYKTIAFQLGETKVDIDDALSQMNFLTSEGLWADYWGVQYYNTARKEAETDRRYTRRVIQEILKPRITNFAIEEALETAFGFPFDSVKVIDHRPILTNMWCYTMLDVPAAEYASPCNLNPRENNPARMLDASVSVANPVGVSRTGAFTVWLTYDESLAPFYSTSDIRDFVERFKAAGTMFDLRVQTRRSEERLHSDFTEEVIDAILILDEGFIFMRDPLNFGVYLGAGLYSTTGGNGGTMYTAHAQEQLSPTGC